SQDLDDFILVGHSFGAMIAAEFAAHFPKRSTHLALLAPFGLWNDHYPIGDLFAVPYMQLDDILWHDPTAREHFRKAPASLSEGGHAAAEAIRLAQSLTAVTKFVWPLPDRGL